MALIYDGKFYLSLQEQVEKNKNDISLFMEGREALANYGIRIVGQIEDANDLPNVETYLQSGGVYGDGFVVGLQAPYDYYIFTRPFEGQTEPQWLNIGSLSVQGPQGPTGETGATGPAGVSSKWISGTTVPANSLGEHVNDQYLNTSNGNVYQFNGTSWVLIGNIRGQKGDTGPQGIRGETGAQGPQGIQGVQGESGFAVTIKGELASVASLPDPDTAGRHDAYIIGNRLYVIMEDEDNALIWQDVGFSDPGSRITVNGVYQGEYEMNQKLDKSTTINTVYAVDASGNQVSLPLVAGDSVGSSVVRRTGGGNIYAKDPTQDQHVATKGYSDDKYIAKNVTPNIVHGTNASGTETLIFYSQTPGNGNIPVYTSNGTLRVNNPVNSTDAVSLSYFNTNTLKLTATLKSNGAYTLSIS